MQRKGYQYRRMENFESKPGQRELVNYVQSSTLISQSGQGMLISLGWQIPYEKETRTPKPPTGVVMSHYQRRCKVLLGPTSLQDR